MEPWHYIVLLGAVLLVFAFLKPNQAKVTESKPTTIKDIEETMDQFSAELEEENRQLLQLVSEMKHEHEKHSAKLQGRLEVLERQNVDVAKQLDRLLQVETAAKAAEHVKPAANTEAAASVPIDQATKALASLQGSQAAALEGPPEPTSGMNIRNRYSELFKLEKQGKSIDHIAKKLGMNKGEVMLILQLAKQEDHARA